MQVKSNEIEVVQSILNVLNKCYLLHLQEHHFIQAAICKKDIIKVKKELKRLLNQAAENATMEKGDTAEDAAIK